MKRNKPLQSKAPLRAKKGLDRGDSQLKRTELKKRSDKRSKLMADDRVPLIKQLIEAGFGCEIGPVLAHHGIDAARHCTGRIEGLHELRKRSAGGSLTNRNNLVPACNHCNGFCEDSPATAHELGLVVREGDPDWERLGARNDRS